MGISFKENYNNKLSNQAFTTIRLYDKEKFAEGIIHEIILLTPSGKIKSRLGEAVVVDTRVLLLRQINDFIAYLDTGKSAEEAKVIIKDCYPKKIDWNKQKLALVLLKRINQTPTQKQIFK